MKERWGKELNERTNQLNDLLPVGLLKKKQTSLWFFGNTNEMLPQK